MSSKPMSNNFQEQIQSVIALINQCEVTNPILIAVDGHSAAGKTTLAKTISIRLPNVTIVHMDDFYRVMDENERAALDAAGGYYSYYDWERLEVQILKPLSLGQQGLYQKYNWTANCLGEWSSVQATGIILIEGCYAARPELAPYYDLILLVETPADKRLRRQYERADATQMWLDRWDAAEKFYIEHYQPYSYADMVIAGE